MELSCTTYTLVVTAGAIGAGGDPGLPNNEVPEAPLQPVITANPIAMLMALMPLIIRHNEGLTRLPEPFFGTF
jgi:hypothetical protein